MSYVAQLIFYRKKITKLHVKCRLKAGYSCYHSVQTLLSSRILSKNFKIKIPYKTIILPVVLYGCEHGLIH